MRIAICNERKEMVTELLKVGADVSKILLISSKHIINIVYDSLFELRI